MRRQIFGSSSCSSMRSRAIRSLTAPFRRSSTYPARLRTGIVAILRHASAPGTGDPASFRLDDCTTQRNLDARGRGQARKIGAATVKQLTRTESTAVIMFYFALTTTLLSLVPAILTWQTPTAIEFGLLFVTGFLGIVGQSAFTHGIALGETGFVLPIDYLRIVYAFVIGIVWFAEMPGIRGIAGAGVIVASSLLLLKEAGRR